MRKLLFVAVLLALWMIFFTGQALAQSQGQEQQKREKSQWAPSVNFMIGKFNTDQTSQSLEKLTGYELDFSGRSWDIGAVRGRPGHSYFRISYVEVRFSDGSWADNGYVKFVTSGDVKLRGIRAERLIRMGPAKWPVAPMVTVHGGIGKVSGQMAFTRESWSWDPALRQSVQLTETGTKPAEDLRYLFRFKSRWNLLGGIGFGVTGEIRNYATVTFSILGLEYPGTYRGQIQFVYWPWRNRY